MDKQKNERKEGRKDWKEEKKERYLALVIRIGLGPGEKGATIILSQNVEWKFKEENTMH